MQLGTVLSLDLNAQVELVNKHLATIGKKIRDIQEGVAKDIAKASLSLQRALRNLRRRVRIICVAIREGEIPKEYRDHMDDLTREERKDFHAEIVVRLIENAIKDMPIRGVNALVNLFFRALTRVKDLTLRAHKKPVELGDPSMEIDQQRIMYDAIIAKGAKKAEHHVRLKKMRN